MTISLFDVSVLAYRQCLAGLARTLDKAREHLPDGDLPGVVETALYPDMKPFRFQVHSVLHHSLGALEGLRTGQFAPPQPALAFDFATLQHMVADGSATLDALTPGDVDPLAAGEVVFSAGERRVRFGAADFVLSFSLPNLYFHAATAYDILRLRGVPLEKLDYLGRPRGTRA